MKIIFRVDSSYKIGSGHVMRCLTLAQALSRKSGEVLFICRDFSGNLISHISSMGFPVEVLPDHHTTPSGEVPNHADLLSVSWITDARQCSEIVRLFKPDWIVVDNYALDYRWEEHLLQYCRNMMVIDDLADRHHRCSILLDQNYYENMEGRYSNKIPKGCCQLLGPRYALLREEFIKARELARLKTGPVNRLLVFMGGSDLSNETAKVLRALKSLELGIEVDVVIGGSNPHRALINEMCNCIDRTKLHVNINNMAEKLLEADLVIGAGGSTTWERCCLGIPGIAIAVAQNQVELAQTIHKFGLGYYLGTRENVTEGQIAEEVQRVVDIPLDLAQMSKKCMDVVDGNGAHYVVDALCGLNGNYTPL